MTISNLPPIPNRNNDPNNFRAESDVFVAALQTFINETNAFADGVNDAEAVSTPARVNAAASEVTTLAQAQASAASANFKGAWAGKTGPATIPYAVSHEDQIWVLKSSIADIAASEPSDSNTDWANFNAYSAVRKPFPIAPLDGATGVSLPTVLEASPYAPSISIDTRTYRRFEVTTPADTTFSSPVFSTDVDADTVEVSPNLDLDTAYIWRCKDVSILNESPWMNTQGFTVTDSFVVAPTLTVEGSPTSVPESPTLTGSAFTTVPDGGDTHLNTDWQVLEGVTVVYESLADASNLTSIVVPAGNLDPNTEYTFRVRYRGNSFGVSAFTEVVATTLETFDIVPLLAVGLSSSPFVTIYNQEIDTFTKLADPSTLPAGTGRGVDFSSDDTYMAVAHATTPFITIYKRDVDVFTKLANPATLPASTGRGVAFSNDDTYMAVAHEVSPFITIYKRSGDTFTKLANPSTLPPFEGRGVAFSSDATYLAVAHATSPFITIYKRSGDTFTKLTNPAVLPTNVGTGVDFSSDDTYMAVSHATTPFITIYKRSGDTFTKLANPSTLPASTGNGVAFSSDTIYLTVVHATSPFITIYKRSGDTFTKLADPATLPPSTGNGVAFSGDAIYLSVAHQISPFITIYKRSGDTFTKLADPDTLPTSNGLGVAFSNTGFPQ